jgi:hypothetical protein
MEVPAHVAAAFKIDTSVPMHESDPCNKIKVETGIPLKDKKAKKAHPRKGKSIYPFAQMRPPRENGDMDSFFIRDDKARTEQQNKQRIASAIYGYKQSHPQFKGEFKYRRIGEGIRVWRTK